MDALRFQSAIPCLKTEPSPNRKSLLQNKERKNNNKENPTSPLAEKRRICSLMLSAGHPDEQSQTKEEKKRGMKATNQLRFVCKESKQRLSSSMKLESKSESCLHLHPLDVLSTLFFREGVGTKLHPPSMITAEKLIMRW
ncbi:hypothetical protein CDAR_60281 [Caerostris darwini]|uniref:Uncharacterized protein n=1 Tax=Caerostris darwini TaxID=1538125 RepID=A0AAV4QN22_9ARAC|nr:hypothetical protein CDAR_60281 [Caerostris darwini]